MSRPTMTRGGSGLSAPPRPAVYSAPAPEPTGRALFALRAREVRRASWRWKIAVPGLVLLLVLAVWFVLFGPVLVLKNVAVTGVPSSMTQPVRTAAALPQGEQLVHLDLSAAQRRVAAIPAVRRVSVSRSWPSGVTIAVTLRQPVAVVKDGSGALHLADATGTTYADVASAPAGLPVVSATASDPAAVKSVVQVLGSLPAGLRSQVSSAGAKSPDAVILQLGAVTVVWGDAEDTALKVQVLKVLRRTNPSARHFDLSAPRSPAIG
jgi:cell division protein FtsQ